MIRRSVRSDNDFIRKYDEFTGDRKVESMRAELFVYILENNPVGYITISNNLFLNYPMISYLCVQPEHRRKYIATKLISHIRELYHGCPIWVTTEEWNQPMKDLLLKNGFGESGALKFLNKDGSRECFYVNNPIFPSSNNIDIQQ